MFAYGTRRVAARPDTHLDDLRRTELPGYGVLRESGRRFRYSVRVLDSHHVDEVLGLQEIVLSPLRPPLPLYVRDQEFFLKCIDEIGCVVGALHEGRLIAYATLHAPGVHGENLGTDLGLTGGALNSVAHLAGSAVHPAYRGNRLQSRLVELREEFARQAGFEHLCGEVIPGNSISIRNHLAVGYFLKAFRIDRLGEPNFVLDKELQCGAPMLRPCELAEASTDDIRGFREMMRRGRWGFRTADRALGTVIEFGRFA